MRFIAPSPFYMGAAGGIAARSLIFEARPLTVIKGQVKPSGCRKDRVLQYLSIFAGKMFQFGAKNRLDGLAASRIFKRA